MLCKYLQVLLVEINAAVILINSACARSSNNGVRLTWRAATQDPIHVAAHCCGDATVEFADAYLAKFG
jgi:hypothetical protein